MFQIEEGYGIGTVQELLGHKDVKTATNAIEWIQLVDI